MEILETLENIISNLGFPIACCIVLFKQNAKFVEAINGCTDALKELIKKVDDIDTK